MMKHTPGPWMINTIKKDRINISTKYQNVGCAYLMVTSEDKEDVEMQANAKLIAAAPELLEALKQCVASLEYWFPRWGDREGVNSQMMKNARYVIEKATI